MKERLREGCRIWDELLAGDNDGNRKLIMVGWGTRDVRMAYLAMWFLAGIDDTGFNDSGQYVERE